MHQFKDGKCFTTKVNAHSSHIPIIILLILLPNCSRQHNDCGTNLVGCLESENLDGEGMESVQAVHVCITLCYQQNEVLAGVVS